MSLLLQTFSEFVLKPRFSLSESNSSLLEAYFASIFNFKSLEWVSRAATFHSLLTKENTQRVVGCQIIVVQGQLNYRGERVGAVPRLIEQGKEIQLKKSSKVIAWPKKHFQKVLEADQLNLDFKKQLQWLCQVPFFTRFGKLTLTQFLFDSTCVSLNPLQQVYEQGDLDRSFYLVQSGQMIAFVRTRTKILKLYTVQINQLFGFHELVKNQAAKAQSLRAQVSSRILCFSQLTFRSIKLYQDKTIHRLSEAHLPFVNWQLTSRLKLSAGHQENETISRRQSQLLRKLNRVQQDPNPAQFQNMAKRQKLLERLMRVKTKKEESYQNMFRISMSNSRIRKH